jgi:hypothetical protein
MTKVLATVALAASLYNSAEAFKSSSFRHTVKQRSALSDISALHNPELLTATVDAFHHVVHGVNANFDAFHSTINLADADVALPAAAAPADVSIYSKVDKTGFIGGCANYVEQAIDLVHNLLMKAGLQNTYGFSIILFTVLSKSLHSLIQIYV